MCVYITQGNTKNIDVVLYVCIISKICGVGMMDTEGTLQK